MNKHKFTKWCAAAVMAVFATASQASSISLSPTSQSVALGGQVSFNLNMDFSDEATIGGGLDVFFDASKLSFVSFTFNPGLGDDPYNRRSPDVYAGELNGIAFGSFGGLSGPSTVGTLVFNTLSLGNAVLTTADTDSVAGPFVSNVTYMPMSVSYSGASVNITAVPVPAALWLLFSGLGMLGFVSKKKSN